MAIRNCDADWPSRAVSVAIHVHRARPTDNQSGAKTIQAAIPAMILIDLIVGDGSSSSTPIAYAKRTSRIALKGYQLPLLRRFPISRTRENAGR